MKTHSRRSFLRSLAGFATASWLADYHLLTASERGKVKITDIKVMIMEGPRTYILVKVESDSGLYGIAEAYGSPGIGVKEQVLGLRQYLVGEDPFHIGRFTSKGIRSDGSAHALMRAISGVEMAVWDLAGKILDVPTTTLLGGRYRDKVRVYNHAHPTDMNDKGACREWAASVREDPSGFSAHKFGFPHTSPDEDPGRDLSNRRLSTKELIRVRQGYENCREAIGFEHDLMVHCHWEYDLRTSILLAQAVADVQPLFLEDPLPVAYSESWRRLAGMSPVPILTGENWMRANEALPFVTNHGCDILHPDLRNSGGFLENKKMADLADFYYLPMANHNTGSLVNTMATVQWAAAIRDYVACETVIGKGDWMDDVILHDGPIVKDGFIEVPTKPGLGVELNREVVEAHLADGETWWG